MSHLVITCLLSAEGFNMLQQSKQNKERRLALQDVFRAQDVVLAAALPHLPTEILPWMTS